MKPKKALITLLRTKFMLHVVLNPLMLPFTKCKKKSWICLTTTLKQAQTVMKQAVTHLLMSILKLSHYEDCILSNLES